MEVERTVEVSRVAEHAILPVEQHVAEVEVTPAPVVAVQLVVRVDAEQIVEVYLVSRLILVVSEVQLVSHLVGEEQSLFARLTVAHCAGCHHEAEHHYYCCEKPFHNISVLKVIHYLKGPSQGVHPLEVSFRLQS